MNRTTLSLPADVTFALKREAQRRHSSVSAVAREVLSDHFGLESAEKREISFAGIVSDDDPRYRAARMEETLAEWADEAAEDALGRRGS